jgi:hypothetical protein
MLTAIVSAAATPTWKPIEPPPATVIVVAASAVASSKLLRLKAEAGRLEVDRALVDQPGGGVDLHRVGVAGAGRAVEGEGAGGDRVGQRPGAGGRVAAQRGGDAARAEAGGGGGALAVGAVEQDRAVELGLGGDVVDLGEQRLVLLVEEGALVVGDRAGLGLDGERLHALEDVGGARHAAVGDLEQRGGLAGVDRGLLERGHVRLDLGADRERGRVVGRLHDREPLESFASELLACI